MVEDQADVAAFADYKPGSEAAAPSGAAQQNQAAQSAPQQSAAQQSTPQQQQVSSSSSSGERLFISPLAKRIANENNVPTEALRGQGSGPEGRVIRSDVDRVIAQKASRPQETVSQAAPAQTTAQATSTAAKASKPAAAQAGANPYEDIPVTNVRSVKRTRNYL